MRKKGNIIDSHPYLRQTLNLVTDKWAVAALYVLSHGTKRYSQLQKDIGDISQRMLTSTLRELERNGLIKRKVYAVVPPMVEYSLTDLGATLNETLKMLCSWSIENFHRVEAARLAYDEVINKSEPKSNL